MEEQARIIKALKEIGHNVDEAKFSEKMKSPEFVERVRKTLVDEGHQVSDSTNFYNKYSTKQVPVKVDEQESPSVMSQVGSGIRTGLETVFPRVTSKIQSEPEEFQGILPEIKSAGSRLVDYAIPGILDAASFPGRLATGILQGTTKSGIPDGRKFQESVARTESEAPGVGGFVEDIVRSPYNVVGGVGSIAAKGVGGVTTRLAPELLPTIARMLPKGKIVTPLIAGLGQVARGAGTAADIGITENISQGKNTFEGLADNLLLGTAFGSIPGAYQYAKGRNTEKIAEAMLPKLEAMGANIPKNRPERLLADLDLMAQEIGVKLPADQIGKIQAIPQLLEKYNTIKGTKLTQSTFADAVNAFQAPKNQGYGALDVGDLLSLGAIVNPEIKSWSAAAAWPVAKTIEKNTPFIEKYSAPIADKISPLQNLARGIMGSYISR